MAILQAVSTCCKHCECPYELGCIPNCNEICFDMFAPMTGKYTFIFKTGVRNTSIKTKEFNLNDKITFPAQYLHDAADYTVFILTPDGNKLCLQLLEDDATDTNPAKVYKCFCFTTVIQKKIKDVAC